MQNKALAFELLYSRSQTWKEGQLSIQGPLQRRTHQSRRRKSAKETFSVLCCRRCRPLYSKIAAARENPGTSLPDLVTQSWSVTQRSSMQIRRSCNDCDLEPFRWELTSPKITKEERTKIIRWLISSLACPVLDLAIFHCWWRCKRRLLGTFVNPGTKERIKQIKK